MPKYTVYTQRLVPSGRATNYATLEDYDVFKLVLDYRAFVEAPTVEIALESARRLGIFAPIISPFSETFQ